MDSTQPPPSPLGVRRNYNLNPEDYRKTLQTTTSNVSASEYADYGNSVRLQHDEGLDRDSLAHGHERYPSDTDGHGLFTPDDLAENHAAPSYPAIIEVEELQKPIRLSSQLLRALHIPRQGSPDQFLPRAELIRICGEDNVRRELERFQEGVSVHQRRSDDEWTECVEWITESRNNNQSSREIFAILSLMGRGHMIWDFKKANIRDSDLPFSRSQDNTKLWCKSQKGKDPRLISFLSDDDDLLPERIDFYQKQWWVHTPYIGLLNGKAQHYDLEDGTIMPWSAKGSDSDRREGGYGWVQMVQIHESHHSFYPRDMKFALKTLIRGNDDPLQILKDFRRECLALNSLKQDSHVVELCATFNLGGDCMMLFPWAGGGSLNDLWDLSEGKQGTYPFELCQKLQHSPRAGKRAFMHWIAHQCLGLSTALAEMHAYTQPPIPQVQEKCCRHGDIKPHNILYFSQEQDALSPLGKLKLSDFGLAELHSIHSRTVQPGPGPQTQKYRAPEYDMITVAAISLPADVWSLGCVFTELLTWVVKGPPGVATYGDERVKEPTFPPTATKSIGADDFFCRPKMNGTMSDPRGGGENHATNKDLKRKTSVDRWCRDVVAKGTTAHDPTFLGDFMKFTTTKMMHPLRAKRASSQDVADFLNKCISDWPIDEPGSYWDCNIASREHQPGLDQILNGRR